MSTSKIHSELTSLPTPAVFPHCYHPDLSCSTLSLLVCCNSLSSYCAPAKQPEGPCQDWSQILSLHAPTFRRGKAHTICSRYLSGLLACLSPQPSLYSSHTHLLTRPNTSQAQPCSRAFACAVPDAWVLFCWIPPGLLHFLWVPAQKSQRRHP